MKIGFVLDDGLDKPDGVQQYILTLGKWLTNEGHEVHYLVGQSQQRDGLIIHSLAKNVKVQFNHNRMSMPLPVKKQRIQTLLAEQNYDVLHVQMPYSPLFGARVISLSPDKTAVVGTFHVLPYGLTAKTAIKILGLILKHNGKRFDTILSNSEATQQFAEETYGIKTQILPCVVDIKALHANRPHNSIFTIVFLGRLVERKGCEALLRSVALLPAEIKQQIRVMIGGRGPLLAKLEKLSKTLGLVEQVVFRGFITENDKAAFLAQADLAIFPAFSGESFGIVLLEAMAAGAGVVLAGNNPGYSSVLGIIPEVIFDPKNHIAMAKKIELFIRDPKLCSEIHRKQQDLVKQYDVSVVGKKLVAIYAQAIAKRAANLDNAKYDI